MAILKMKKLRLCGIAEEQTQLIRELQLLGSVEIGSPEALTGAQQTQIFRAGDSSSNGGGAERGVIKPGHRILHRREHHQLATHSRRLG